MQGPPSHGSRLVFPLGHLGFEPCYHVFPLGPLGFEPCYHVFPLGHLGFEPRHHMFPLGHLGFEPCHHVFPANNGVVASLGFISYSLGGAPFVMQQLQDPRIHSKTPSTPIDAAFFDCARSCSQWFTHFTRLSLSQM